MQQSIGLQIYHLFTEIVKNPPASRCSKAVWRNSTIFALSQSSSFSIFASKRPWRVFNMHASSTCSWWSISNNMRARIEKLIRAGIRIALTMPSVNYWALSGVSNLALDAFLWNVWESFHRRRFWCWSAAGGQKVHHEMSFDWREKAVFLQSTAKAEPPSSVEEKGEVIDQLESKFLGMYIVYRS